MHTVMQHLPFQQEGLDETALNDYIDSLIAKNIIPEDAKKIFKWLTSCTLSTVIYIA